VSSGLGSLAIALQATVARAVTDVLGRFQLLRAAHGLERLTVGARLRGGYANDLWRAAADGCEVVLRVQREADAADLCWEHDVVRALAAREPLVVAPIAAPDGTTVVRDGDRAAWLLPYVDAPPATACDALAAARALARVHRAGLALSQPPRTPRPRRRPLQELAWPPAVAPPELAAWAPALPALRAWAIDVVAAVATRGLPTGLIHGDVFPGNVLVRAGDAVAVIDWEEARPDWLTWDLACAAGAFGGDLHAFAGAYRAAGGPARPQDDDLLAPLARVKLVLEVLRARTDRDPQWEQQRCKLRRLTAGPRPR
jgi:Ser/Thr protein kinase RdoA (MazF antagonist)